MKLLSFRYLLNSRFKLKIYSVNNGLMYIFLKVFFLVRFKRFYDIRETEREEWREKRRWRLLIT